MTGESRRLVDVPIIENIAATDTVFVSLNGVVSQANANTIFNQVNLCVNTMVIGACTTPIGDKGQHRRAQAGVRLLPRRDRGSALHQAPAREPAWRGDPRAP